MSDIDASCPHCGIPVRLNSGMVDKRARCPHCERAFKVTADLFPEDKRKAPEANATTSDNEEAESDEADSGEGNGGLTPFQVNIVGLDMPFADLTKLIFKIMLAALPAAVCFSLIVAGIILLIGLVVPGCDSDHTTISF